METLAASIGSTGWLVAATLGLGAVRLLVEPVVKWLTDRAVRQERVRLTEILGPIALEADLGGGATHRRQQSDRISEPSTPPPSSGNESQDGEATEDSVSQRTDRTTEPGRSSDLAERFAPLLIEYYAYGLVRARRHDTTSLLMSTLGGMITLVGVGNLLLFARTGSAVAASGTSAAVGILTNAMAVLFHRQAGLALKHMQDQTLSLRDDMRKETDSIQAVNQLDQIHDAALRDRLRAGLVLRLSGALLPDLHAPGGSPLQPLGQNKLDLHQRADETINGSN